MKCYNHIEYDAVAQCRVCRKYLCKSCYDNSNDGICSVCSRKDMIAEIEYQRVSRKRSIKECQQDYKRYVRNLLLAGLAGGALSCLIIANSLLGRPTDIIAGSLIITILTCYIAIATYSGYEILRGKLPDIIDIEDIMGLRIIVNFFYNLIKLPVATVIGVFGAIPLYLKMRRKYLKTKL